MKEQVAYLYDDRLCAAANQRGENYWYRYVEELFDELGVAAEAVPFSVLAKRSAGLAGCRVLVLGDYDASLLPSEAPTLLRQWLARGGILIGLKTCGFDELFGVARVGPDVEAAPFTIGGWISLKGREEASGLFDELFPETLCPVMSPFRRIAPSGAISLTNITPNNSSVVAPQSLPEQAYPAIMRHDLGKGKAYYFAFNLPQAVWTYHRGRPVTRDLDSDGYLRSSDSIMVPQGPVGTVPCADLMLLVLENILAQAGAPFIHQLPPLDGQVPDALFHYGGDDEGQDGLQAKMSEIMKSFGLPYHINVMLHDGRFHFTDEDRALYEKNGHEFSLHFNFISYPDGVKHPAPIEESEYDRQFRLFVERYGKIPICSNNHYCCTSGWADTARFGARHGSGERTTASITGARPWTRSTCLAPPSGPCTRILFMMTPRMAMSDWISLTFLSVFTSRGHGRTRNHILSAERIRFSRMSTGMP